jgi:hypothetical protein
MFAVVAFLIFSVALFAAGYYVWSVPQQAAENALGARLRELRAHARSRSKAAPDLLRRERRGSFAFLGDLVSWVGVLRRLQELIEQANLKYRAADVFGLCMLLGVGSFLCFAIFGGGIHYVRLRAGETATIDGVQYVGEMTSLVASNLIFLHILVAVGLGSLRSRTSCGCGRSGSPNSSTNCRTRSTSLRGRCEPGTTSTADWKRSRPRRRTRSGWNSRS